MCTLLTNELLMHVHRKGFKHHGIWQETHQKHPSFSNYVINKQRLTRKFNDSGRESIQHFQVELILQLLFASEDVDSHWRPNVL